MDELLEMISICTNIPLGPDDVSSAKCLLNRNVLTANRREGLGTYAILKGLNIKDQKYIVELNHNKKIVERNWIVKDIFGEFKWM